MIPQHLTDAYSNPTSLAALAACAGVTAPEHRHVTSMVACGRKAIVHIATGEPVQFIVGQSPIVEKHMLDGWERYFESLVERARR